MEIDEEQIDTKVGFYKEDYPVSNFDYSAENHNYKAFLSAINKARMIKDSLKTSSEKIDTEYMPFVVERVKIQFDIPIIEPYCTFSEIFRAELLRVLMTENPEVAEKVYNELKTPTEE